METLRSVDALRAPRPRERHGRPPRPSDPGSGRATRSRARWGRGRPPPGVGPATRSRRRPSLQPAPRLVQDRGLQAGGEREHRRDDPLGDRIVEDAARVGDDDVARGQRREQQPVDPVARGLDPPQPSGLAERTLDPLSLRPPEVQTVRLGDRVAERVAVGGVAELGRIRRGLRCPAAGRRRWRRARRSPGGSQRPPPAEAAVLAVVVGDLALAQTPAQEHPFPVAFRREVDQARCRDRGAGCRAPRGTRPRSSTSPDTGTSPTRRRRRPRRPPLR